MYSFCLVACVPAILVNIFICVTYVIDFKVSNSLDDKWQETALTFCLERESLTWILVLFHGPPTLRLWRWSLRTGKSLTVSCLHSSYPKALHLILQSRFVLIGAKLKWTEFRGADGVLFNDSWIPSLRNVTQKNNCTLSGRIPTRLETETQKLVPKVCDSTYLFKSSFKWSRICPNNIFLNILFFKNHWKLELLWPWEYVHMSRFWKYWCREDHPEQCQNIRVQGPLLTCLTM